MFLECLEVPIERGHARDFEEGTPGIFFLNSVCVAAQSSTLAGFAYFDEQVFLQVENCRKLGCVRDHDGLGPRKDHMSYGRRHI